MPDRATLVVVTVRRSPRTAWMLAVGIVLVLTVAGFALLPRASSSGAVRAVEPSTTPTTPRASETPTTAAPALASVVGFGDSVMAGAGCDCDDFLVQAGDLLDARTGRQVTTTNHGTNGETAAGLLQDLQGDDASAAQIGRADVIVLTIGANDLVPLVSTWQDDGCDADCYTPAVQAMGKRLTALLAIVDREKKPGAAVLVTSYWNVFEDGDVGRDDYGTGFLGWSDQVTRSANRTICRAAAGAKATCVDLYAPFKADGDQDPTELLADDGDHPNARGTQLIASAVAAAAAPLLAH